MLVVALAILFGASSCRIAGSLNNDSAEDTAAAEQDSGEGNTAEGGGEDKSVELGLGGDDSELLLFGFVEDEEHDFGAVATGGSDSKSFSLTNSGKNVITELEFEALAAPFSIAVNTCIGELQEGESCEIEVAFSPSSQGVHGTSLLVSFMMRSARKSASVDLAGKGVAPAVVSATSGASVDFAVIAPRSVASSAITFTNSSADVTARVTSVSLGASAPFSVSGDCSSLAPQATCDLSVQFSPSASGAFTETLVVKYHDGAQSGKETAINLSGEGASPASLTVQGTGTFDFGEKVIGSSTQQAFTLSNSGELSATSIALSAAGSAFSVSSGSCGATLAVGSTCAFAVNFQATGSGANQSGTIAVSYHDGVNSASTVSRELTGTGGTAASLSLSPGATYDYGLRSFGYSSDVTFTLSNSGELTASSVQASVNQPFEVVSGGNCGSSLGGTLSGANSCTLVARYLANQWGVRSETLQLAYDSGQSTSVVLKGIAGNRLAVSKLAHHNCVIQANGAVKCWGYNNLKQVGDGTTTHATAALTAAGLGAGSGVISIGLPSYSSCFLFDTGSIQCLGSRATGVLGDGTVTGGSSSSLLQVFGIDGTASGKKGQMLSSGGTVSCAVLDTGDVKCWGGNFFGALGDGSNVIVRAKPAMVTGLGGAAKEVSAGRNHACALLAGGAVKCWGNFENGALGVGAISDNDTTTILYNDGSGALTTSTTLDTGSNELLIPLGVAAGDFNADGKKDVATVFNGGNESGSSCVAVYFRKGDNTGFDDAIVLPTTANATAIAVGNFNADSQSDIAIASKATTTGVQVYTRNAANNGFDAVVSVATSQNTNYGLIAGDFKEDGRDDLISSLAWANNGTNIILRNAGNTGFDAETTFTVVANGAFRYIEKGDFNADGNLDIAVAASNPGTSAYVAFGGGDGTFSGTVTLTAASSEQTGVTSGDFNGDGRDDVVILGGTANTFRLFLRNVNNDGFQAGVDTTTGDFPAAAAVGDFNSDGDLDIAVANAGANTVSIFPGNGDGTFGTRADVSVGQAPLALTVTDFNGDGKADLAVANSGLRLKPVQVLAAGSDVVRLSTGQETTCALLTDGTSKCWGANANLQLNVAGGSSQYAPVDSGLSDVSQMGNGTQATCWTLRSGSVKCAGYDFYGRTGDGTTGGNQLATTFGDVDGSGGNQSKAYESYTGMGHSCALLFDNQVKCAGRNDFGQLGNGTTNTPNATPALVSGL